MMTTQQLDVSVVICAYTEERWDDLVAAVESVKNQTVPAREIIVVVDHNPALLERVRRAHIAEITVIPNGEAPGLSGARNTGIAATTAAIVAFLDDDAVATPDWIRRLGEAYDTLGVIGVGGGIEPLWEEGRPAWFPQEFDWVVGCTYRGMPEDPAVVRNLIGANMSIRREIFERVGGFHNGVGQTNGNMLRCDDTEFCIRIGQSLPNGVFRYIPEARVLHRVPRGRAQWSYFCNRCYTEGLAKAQVTRLVGARDGLSAERSYTLVTLPHGVFGRLSAAIRRRDLAPLTQAGAIIYGLTLTTAGYLKGRLSARLQAGRARDERQIHARGGSLA